jgi:hypothetical protein
MFKVIKTAEEITAEKAQQERDNRIAELKKLLADSDYKVMPDYDKPNEDIKAQRQTWREEIRTLKQS